MRYRIFNRALGWAAAGLLGAASLLACAADTAPIPRTPATNAPPSVATIELDVPVVEPIPSLQHGLSKAGRRHNSNCRYWKSVVSPPDPAKQKNVCKICGG
jgi:hypothetical protein